MPSARLPAIAHRLVLTTVAVLLVAGIAPGAVLAHADHAAQGAGATTVPRAASVPGEVPAQRPASATTKGLRVAQQGRCAGGYQVVGTPFCSHGPDTRPAGRRLTLQPRTVSSVIEGPLPGAVVCDGDGVSGKRVHAIYARTAATPSRRSTVVPQIRVAAAAVQSAFLASAARTDGVRRPRWVTDGSCRLKVSEVVLSEAARTSFGTMIGELQALGHDRPDRKYLVWFDTSVYCGIATFWGDDRPTPDNLSNTRAGYARVDAGCWGWAEAHELMHTLGAVQNTAPNTTYGVAPGAFGHCTDDWDVMCYPDAPGVTMTVVCPDRALDGQFDCGNDDYFHTDPPAASYLGGHWNTADSDWLERSVVQLAVPAPGLIAGASVAAGRVPVTVPLAARAPLAGVETIDAQRRLAAQPWQPAAASPGALTLTSRLPTGTPARFRARAVDAAGTAGPWAAGPTRTARLRGETHRSLTWRGGWRRVADATALGGFVRRSGRAGAAVTFRTTATEFGVVAATGPDRGKLQVWVDGRRVAVADLYAPEPGSRRLVVAQTLSPGATHSVELRVAPTRNAASSGRRVDIDAIALLAR